MNAVEVVARGLVALAEGVALGLFIVLGLAVLRSQFQEQDEKYRARRGE